jgi:dihydrofolate synthase/folylpolyglutamate synthase
VSKSTASLDQALDRIYARTAAGIRPGLDAIKALLEVLEHPEKRFLVIHIAGTNGKGSVACLIESILRVIGFKTGLFTSPHLVRFHERFRVNGDAISDAELEPLVRVIDSADIEMLKRGGPRPCTFFELSTAMAFEHFARSEVQVAVIETGMGGAWDSTNVVDPLVSVITRIGMDHMNYLGDSLLRIAGEKCGIIKPGRPVVSTRQETDKVDAIIEEAAQVAMVPYLRFTDDVGITPKSMNLDGQKFLLETPNADYGTCTLNLLGRHQLENAALAVAASEIIVDQLGIDLPEQAVKKGLASARWAGRCSVVNRDPPIIIDGAHNHSGAEALADTLDHLFPGKKGAFVLGFLDDKQGEAMLAVWKPRVDQAWGVVVQSPRSLKFEAMQSLLQGANISHVMSGLSQALEQARNYAKAHDTFVCVVGSLYLAGESLRLTGSSM